MGIVVTFFMLLALLLESPIPALNLNRCHHVKRFISFIGFGLMMAGVWNLGWFGFRHMTAFWGQAAIVSGLCMIVIAVSIIDKHALIEGGSLAVFFNRKSLLLQPFYDLFLSGLFLSFLLYFVTLVRLNLDYSIIQ